MAESPTLFKSLTCEFVGTYLLVLTVGCNTAPGASGVSAALSIAAVLMVSIYSMGPISGGHFNPAVSLSLFFAELKAPRSRDGPSPIAKLVAYVLTQCVAGIAAGTSSRGLHGAAMQLEPGTGLDGEPFHWSQVMAVELLYTFMLCFVVLRAALSGSNPKENEYFGLAIAFVIVAGGYAGGWVSKGCFNPAVALGIDFASHEQTYWAGWYAVYECIGALLACLVHVYIDDVPGTATTRAVRSPLSEPARWFVSEFLGTYFLVLTVGLNVLGKSPAGALSIGASLMCMIYALGAVSGAHFNPAVTTALVLAGKCEVGRLPTYLLGQLLGGICAGLTYTGIAGQSFALEPGKDYNWMDCAWAEIIYTFVLCFCVLNVAALSKDAIMSEGGKSTCFYGLAIGACIIAGGNAIGQVSGGSLNPAVSVGIDTAHAIRGHAWVNCVCYASFELIGASLAALCFYACRDGEFRKRSR